MTDGQKKKISNRVFFLSMGVLALLVAFLIFLGVTKRVNTILFPVGLGVGLLIYWLISDVLSIVWMKGFEGKTDEQKKAYYIYALLDAVSFAGLAYFIVSMDSMTGALIYIACLFLKRRFREQFDGVKPQDDEEEAEETGEIEEAEGSEVSEAKIEEDEQEDSVQELTADEQQEATADEE